MCRYVVGVSFYFFSILLIYCRSTLYGIIHSLTNDLKCYFCHISSFVNLFLGSLICCISLFDVSTGIPHYLNYVLLGWVLISNMARPLTLFFFRIVFAICSPLHFYAVWTSLSSSMKNLVTVFFLLENINRLIWEILTMFTTLSLLNHEHDIKLHLLIFSLRSFNNNHKISTGVLNNLFLSFFSEYLYQSGFKQRNWTSRRRSILRDILQGIGVRVCGGWQIWNSQTGHGEGQAGAAGCRLKLPSPSRISSSRKPQLCS